MQSFRGCTGRIGTNCDETLDSSQAVGIARFESGVLVNNKIMIIIWTKCEIDVGPFSWCGLYLRGTGTLNRREYKIGPNTHRHVHPESSADKRRFSRTSLCVRVESIWFLAKCRYTPSLL